MGTIEVLTKDRMLAIEASSVVSGLVDASGHLILTKKNATTIDAGNVKGATGPSPVYPVGKFTGGLGTQYSRLAVLDGIAASGGADLEFVLSGLGSYGGAYRGTTLVHFVQRGTDVARVKAWSFGFSDATTPVSLYLRQMGPYLFELWGGFSSYTQEMGLTVLSKWNATISIDSASTTMPSGLVLQTIDKVLNETEAQSAMAAAIQAAISPIEKTKLKATIPDPNGTGWFAKGADGVTYGPMGYSSSWIPTPGDEVTVGKNGDGTYSITGAKKASREIALASTSISYRKGWCDPNWEEPSYTLRNGIVQLNGLMATSVATGYSYVIFTLPPEARPDTVMIFPVDKSGSVGAVYVKPDGTVTLESGFLANTYISLSSIAFPVAGRATWTTIPTAYLINGWVDYYGIDTSYGRARYWVDEYGYVWYAGMLRGGTVNTGMIQYPAGHAALSDSRSGHCLVNAGNGVAYAYIPNSGSRNVNIAPAGMSNSWVSLANFSYPSASLIASTSWLTGAAGAGAGGGRDSLYLGSSWGNYDTGETTWSKLKIGQRPDGLVMTRGLIGGGTFGSQSILIPLKEEWTRTRSIIIPTISNGAYGRLDIHGTFNRDASKIGSMTLNSGSSAWFSLDGLKWFPD